MPQHEKDSKYDLTAELKETLHKQILELFACVAAATAKVGHVEGKPSLVGRLLPIADRRRPARKRRSLGDVVGRSSVGSTSQAATEPSRADGSSSALTDVEAA
jgi:hypothetical protein